MLVMDNQASQNSTSDEGSDEVFGRRMEELMSRGVIPDSQKNLHLLPSGSTLPQASVPPNCCSLHQIPMKVNKNIFSKSTLEIVRGSKQYVFDGDGVQYLDCVNGTSHVGHCHPQVVAAGHKQMSKLVTSQGFTSELLSKYVSSLVDTLPEPLSVCYLTNSGSEANDLALRLAAAFSKSQDVLVMEDGYHGNIGSLVEVSPKMYKKKNMKKKDHVHISHLPDMFRGKYRYFDEEAGLKYARDLENKIRQAETKGRRIGAMLCETMFVIPGVHLPPPSFYENVFRIVRDHGGVVILDEVQSGLGRTGNCMWGFQDYGVVPDIVTIGKGLGNGYPLGAVVCSKEISDRLENGYFSTFGGNPVACAIGLSVLEVIKNEKLMSSANRVGKYLQRSLQGIKEKFDCVGDVRGTGLMHGIEIVNNKEERIPDPSLASRIMSEMKMKQIIVAITGRDQNVLLITPPMCFNMENGQTLVETLEIVLSTINQSTVISITNINDVGDVEVEGAGGKRLKLEEAINNVNVNDVNIEYDYEYEMD